MSIRGLKNYIFSFSLFNVCYSFDDQKISVRVMMGGASADRDFSFDYYKIFGVVRII